MLYRIGELSKLANVSPRTIDFYTKIGLINIAKRENNKYRLYHIETIERLERIEYLKKNKNSLEEIKHLLSEWDRISTNKKLNAKLSELEQQLQILEREVKELEPVLNQLSPNKAKILYGRIVPQTAACIEALTLIMNKGSLM